ncbi:hypothetical protein TWF970_007825 [Orbilia oligospora]|uniref:Uncharacterized protein n=1 Tax=Orbilia oligospora TaxID=2813651 RepID=A0A7C8VAV2_ORBOL|nr:hypothetical protein TWF970_007825 [Orbilia oligospora]
MSTRHSSRASKPSNKALESSSASPPNTTGNARATRAPRSTTRSITVDIQNEEELPANKRRRLSPTKKTETSGSRGRGPRASSRAKATKEINPEDDEEPTDVDETPRPKRPGRQATASTRKKASGGTLEEESITLAPPPPPKLNSAGLPQKITNLYGGRKKHKDRDDTPSTVGGSFTAAETSPSKSVRKRGNGSQSQSQQQGAGTGDEAPTGVDKFRRGRHGSAKKKTTPVVQEATKPTIAINDVEHNEATKGATASPTKKRGRKPAAKPDDTDLEGDVIMADSDASPTKIDGRLAPRGTGRRTRGPAQKKDDEGDIFDFPGSDEEDPFKANLKIKSAKKTPSKLTATFRRARVAKEVEEGGSESKGFEGEDEKENEDTTAEEEAIEVRKEVRNLPKFQGKVTEEAVKTLKAHVMQKLTGRGLPESLVGLKDEYNTVYQLVEQTVVAGEGNSILLIGPRGSGKSLVTEKAIATLQKHFEKDFIVVRLSGCLQTDEKTAVKEIWRQLGSSMELDESKPINFADTLTTILALLSHPSEHDPTASQEAMSETTSISVIFLLSEFEQFAAHPRQTLLYNLFDIAQARKAPIAVVGMTSKINIVEDLEKRVKSRFSHRTLGFRTGGSLGSRLEGWWEIAKAGLCVDIDTLPMDTTKTDMAYYSQWNASLDDAFKGDKAFRRTVEGVYSTSKSIQVLYNHLMVSICNISSTMPFLGAGSALSKHALAAPDNKLYLLEDLPELSLAMLIAAARLDPILETDTCNFTMAYDEYKNLVSRVKIYSQTTWGLKLWGKDVALAAWERLAEWELIVPVVGASAYGGGIGVTASLLVGSGNTGVGRRESRMFRVDVGLMEIKRQGRAWGMGSILQGWCTI